MDNQLSINDVVLGYILKLASLVKMDKGYSRKCSGPYRYGDIVEDANGQVVMIIGYCPDNKWHASLGLLNIDLAPRGYHHWIVGDDETLTVKGNALAMLADKELKEILAS